MKSFVALLRGINVGGHKKVVMKDLRDLCVSLGLFHPRTVLASGNLLFDSTLESAELSARLQTSIKEALGVDCTVLVLPAQEFRDILRANPIASEERRGDWLAVLFAAVMPGAEAKEAFLKSHQGPELVEFGERAVYLYYSAGMGRSKLDMKSLFGVAQGTVRNLNTLKKLEELLAKSD